MKYLNYCSFSIMFIIVIIINSKKFNVINNFQMYTQSVLKMDCFNIQ